MPSEINALSSYRLGRIPQDTSLKAWNAADALFLKRLDSADPGQLLLLNDTFGALAVALHAHKRYWWHHSAMATEALVHNSRQNSVDLPDLVDHISTTPPCPVIALQIPKSVNYFAWLLEQAVLQLKDGGTIYALGMVKHLGAGHIDIMNQLFDHVNPGRAEKKARVIELQNPTGQALSDKTHYVIPGTDLTLSQQPGCYAEKKADPGALAFLNYFDRLPKVGRVLDLGCGNGILGLSYAQKFSGCQVCFADENLQALQSAQQNWQRNTLDGTPSWLHSNGLNQLSTKSEYDLILCNPPFHQENTLTETIALKLFRDASQHLAEHGELWLVANRHLAYRPMLGKLFNLIEVVSKHPKFVVIRCAQPSVIR